MSNTIYINSIKVKTGKFGLKVSGKTEDIIKELQQHTNDKGYVNLEIKERKTAGKYGETHSVTVDTWQPNRTAENNTAPAKESTDDLPF